MLQYTLHRLKHTRGNFWQKSSEWQQVKWLFYSSVKIKMLDSYTNIYRPALKFLNLDTGSYFRQTGFRINRNKV